MIAGRNFQFFHLKIKAVRPLLTSIFLNYDHLVWYWPKEEKGRIQFVNFFILLVDCIFPIIIIILPSITFFFVSAVCDYQFEVQWIHLWVSNMVTDFTSPQSKTSGMGRVKIIFFGTVIPFSPILSTLSTNEPDFGVKHIFHLFLAFLLPHNWFSLILLYSTVQTCSKSGWGSSYLLRKPVTLQSFWVEESFTFCKSIFLSVILNIFKNEDWYFWLTLIQWIDFWWQWSSEGNSKGTSLFFHKWSMEPIQRWRFEHCWTLREYICRNL